MIQFNLLPDVKLEYIKARRTKHMVMMVAMIASGVTVAIATLLFLNVNVAQKRHLNNLSADIESKTNQLKSEEDIDKILTVQNQLNSLDGLHDGKPASERLGKYISQVTPNEVGISELSVDFTTNTMTIDGNAKALKFVNEFIDTLKFTNYNMDGQDKNAFSGVVLASFDRTDTDDSSNSPVNFQITLTFDAMIFDIKHDVSLKVPKKITTRSVTERPEPLFQQLPEAPNGSVTDPLQGELQ